MGVHGLWDLLSPVGRRVSVETLAGKRLAIDASIWMVQFMKAMRDEHGEMVRNAHILGFFRRICKLLFLRTKPVFVFDGATPALKRRTVIARRRQRDNAQTKIRKTAEKLLLNHLKAMRLQELADDLENQRKSNVDKGKKVVTEESEIVGTSAKMSSSGTKDFDQVAFDAMLAASLEAEEGGGFAGDASTSGAGVVEDDDEDDDDDEEMLIPALQGKVDPAVLASLPPSMQLDLLGQMRERLMAENRQKYQKVKKAPAKFSQLQIESYLKTVAFRREINEVQKVAGGRAVDGVQTSRIASESNKEFIFSSSFTGNKQSFTSAGVETDSNMQSQTATRHSSTGSVSDVSTNKSSSAFESLINKSKKAFNEDVETYRDERGRVRINKNKAMGIRMTRDLQRNLELMKEIEQEKTELVSKLLESSKETNQESIPISGTTIQVSFVDDDKQQFVDSDDDVFARIVADDTSSEKQPIIDLSDVEWEEGTPGEINEEKPLDESEVEWEDGPSDIPESGSAREVANMETVSKGELLEEAELQEAIRLSMYDMRSQNNVDASLSPEEFKDDKNMDIDASFSPKLSSESVLPNKSSVDVDETKINTTNSSPTTKLEVTNLNDPNIMEVEMEPSDQNKKKDHDQLSIQDASDDQNSQEETRQVDMVNVTEENKADSSNELHGDNCGENTESLISSDNLSPNVLDVILADAQVKDPVIDHIPETLEPEGTTVKESTPKFDIVQNVIEENDSNAFNEKENDVSKFVLTDMTEEQVEITKANLEEEMTNLSKERADLGEEQKRLERNSASVSGEMFTECQELLHMFGLPYIIAPMEAEAQCAYMELENLVDGVVTDDSDVLLFGARSVYKNIFDDRKYVETYFMKDVESELGLTREKLIRMAMLLGSDYTEGVSGIGIVNAVEVLNAFPEEDGLHKFREWIESPDPTILGKVDNKKRKSNNIDEVDQGVSSSEADIDRMRQIFMDKHRNVSKNWHIPSTFPSDTVISAYASPQVDRSTEPFSWGKPDLFVLRKLCFEKFGWGTQKADELLQPVLKEYNKHETQLRLEAFYTFNERFAKIRSKRISKAVKGIAGSKSLELMENTERDPSNGKKRKKVKQEEREIDIDKEPTTTPKNIKKGSSVRGGRGRGRGQSVGRGKRKMNNGPELSETSSDDGNNSDFVHEVNAVRKSKRVRKPVISTMINEDSESDEPTTQEEHAKVAVNEEPVSNDHESPSPGNGIHPEETELDKDWCQNDENVPEADLSKDYLQMGGGFCFDDDEGEKVPEISGSRKPTEELNEAEVSINPNAATDKSQENNEKDDDEMRPVTFLSAMPNLKRKRKKV